MYGALRQQLLYPSHQKFVSRPTSCYNNRGDAAARDVVGKPCGDMFDGGAHKMRGWRCVSGHEWHNVLYKPFLSKRLGRPLAVVFELLHLVEQWLYHSAGRCHGTVVVEGFAGALREAVEQHVAYADVVGNTVAGWVAEGYIGNAAKVEAGVILPKEHLVANGNQRRSLSAEGDIEIAETEHYRQAAGGRNGFAFANLSGETPVGLVENGVAVRGYGINMPGMALTETAHLLAEIMSELNVGKGILDGCGMLKPRKTLYPRRGIRYGFGRQQLHAQRLSGFVLEMAVGYVKPVERGARHKSDDSHGCGC